MKVAIIGSRGIPARYGGFETFVEHLVPALVENGFEVTVINEKNHSGEKLQSGNLKILESSFSKSAHPVLFYWDSVRRASTGQDAVIVCGVGGTFFYPFYKNKGTAWITNVDGLEHYRTKFSALKKWYVRQAQRMAVRMSDFIVADSKAIAEYWIQELNSPSQKTRVIEYGADVPHEFDTIHLKQQGLDFGIYYLVVARFVPENHVHEIIRGFHESGTKRKLVIVGGADPSPYIRHLHDEQGANTIFTGTIYDKTVLDSLRTGAFAYLHGHSVGGTNPALLEAMACSCVCICHDNPFNREVTDSKQLYFNEAKDLAKKIVELENLGRPGMDELKKSSVRRVQEYYSWDRIREAYLTLIREVHDKT